MDFVSVATNLGIAAACLMALGLGVWRALIWVGNAVALPVALRHIKFLDDLTTAMTSQSQALQTMSIQQGKNLEGIHQLLEMVKLLLEQQEHLVKTISDVHERLLTPRV